jgi:hypothetical protein
VESYVFSQPILDVFSAEDQEWSRWVFTDRGLRIAHIKGAGADNINPRKSSVTKKINEWVCVAFYSYPKYLTFWFIANRIGKSIKCLLKGEVRQFVFWVIIVLALLRTRFFSPKGNSSYF